jgi:hypothetical protein
MSTESVSGVMDVVQQRKEDNAVRAQKYLFLECTIMQNNYKNYQGSKKCWESKGN